MSSARSAPRRRPPSRRASSRRPSTLIVYRWELRKLLAQVRTYLGLGLLTLLPVIFVVFESLHHQHDQRDEHLRRADHPVRPRDAGADAAVQSGLLPAGRRCARRRRHLLQRGRQRHAEDDPHALGRPRAGVPRQDARGLQLRRARCARRRERRDDRGRRVVGLSLRHGPTPARSCRRPKRCCSCPPPTPPI